MGFKALITFDLPDANSDQHKKLNDYLSSLKGWKKISNMSTAWEVSFNNDLDREAVIERIKRRFTEAQKENKIKRIEYAVQMNEIEKVVIDHLLFK